MSNERSRGFCFTINNPSSFDEIDLEDLVKQTQYTIIGYEKGESGTLHWQGYCYFSNKKSFEQIKAILPRAHIEKQRGSCTQAIDYCKKDGDWKEWGNRPSGGTNQTHKWKEIIQLAKQGRIEAIEDQYPAEYLRYYKMLLGLHKPEHPIILQTLENEWWFGDTGTGKSRELWERFPNHYQKPLNKWWDGYSGEEVVAIEEWSPKNEVTASLLKIWADRYPFCAEVKGGTLQKIRPKKIIVLSNYKPQDCFTNAQDLGPILRRFKIKHFVTIYFFVFFYLITIAWISDRLYGGPLTST